MRVLFRILSSLQLTVLLFGFSIALVFFGTLDQVHYGIHEAQRRYFESLYVVWQYPVQWVGGAQLNWIRIPLPGGYVLGSLLLVNLFAGHFRFFRPTWKKSGIVMIHTGVVFLIVSGFLSSALQEESVMWIDEGNRSNYSVDYQDNELVIIDRTDPDWDEVVSIPLKYLEKGIPVTHPQLPFTVETVQFFVNAQLRLRAQNPQAPPSLATRGEGPRIAVFPQAPTYKESTVNQATAYVKLKTEKEDLGTWLVSNVMEEYFAPQLFEYAGREYAIALRFRRYYHPFWIELKDFRFDRYPGTEIPRNFSSEVNIINPGEHEPRQALFYMNHPLRYAGLTFFQSSFDEATETSSALMVVRNPSWRLPYISVFLVGLGMAVQFLMHLIRFLKRRKV